jgi:voltage-gated potassium channel
MIKRRFHRPRSGIARRPAGDRILGWFRLPLALLVAVTVYGVVGYLFLEGWSLLDAVYMTVITLATVGFHEVRPLAARGQVFTISLILAGVMALFVALGVVTELVVSGQLARVLRRRRMDARIGRLDRHTVICAYGRVGRAVAEELARQGLPFVVVERQQGHLGLASLRRPDHRLPHLRGPHDPRRRLGGLVLRHRPVARQRLLPLPDHRPAAGSRGGLTGRGVTRISAS